MAKSFDTLTDELFATCIDATGEGVGDPIIYACGGFDPLPISAFVNHRDKTEALAGSQLTDQDILVEVLKTDVPTVTTADIITLSRLDITVSPRDWHSDDAGRSWIIYVKRVRA